MKYIVILLMLVGTPVMASGDRRGDDRQKQTQRHQTEQQQNQRSRSDANAISRSGATARAGAAAGAVATGGVTESHGGSGGSADNQNTVESNSEGGAGGDGGAASNDGNTYSSSHRSANFYVSRSLPQIANKCGLSADGGFGDDGKAGFLGWQWIDHNCWMNALAEEEANAEMKALLNCESKRFRNAVAYDQPTKERQAFCVGFAKEIYLAEIQEQRSALIEAMQHELDLRRAGLPKD